MSKGVLRAGSRDERGLKQSEGGFYEVADPRYVVRNVSVRLRKLEDGGVGTSRVTWRLALVRQDEGGTSWVTDAACRGGVGTGGKEWGDNLRRVRCFRQFGLGNSKLRVGDSRYVFTTSP